MMIRKVKLSQNNIPIYPKLHHDKKRSTKLTINDIIEIRQDFSKNPNYKIFAEKYSVVQPTIKYWVNEDYRQNHIRKGIIRTREKLKNEIYRIESNKNKRLLLLSIKKGDPIRYKQLMLCRDYSSKYSAPRIVKLQYWKDYRQKNLKKLKAERMIYYLKNQNKITKRARKFKLEHPDKIKEYSKKYRLKYQDKLKEQQRERRLKQKVN